MLKWVKQNFSKRLIIYISHVPCKRKKCAQLSHSNCVRNKCERKEIVAIKMDNSFGSVFFAASFFSLFIHFLSNSMCCYFLLFVRENHHWCKVLLHIPCIKFYDWNYSAIYQNFYIWRCLCTQKYNQYFKHYLYLCSFAIKLHITQQQIWLGSCHSMCMTWFSQKIYNIFEG